MDSNDKKLYNAINEELYVRAKKTFQQAFQQDVFQSAKEFVTRDKFVAEKQE